MTVSRRTLLVVGAGLVGAGGAVAAALRALARGPRHPADGRYGPLRRDPAGILDLPEGFRYRVLDRRGDEMSDGHRVPWQPDAMACFPGPDPDTFVVLRNHECEADPVTGPWTRERPIAPESYDPRGMGGVTRLVVDAETFELRSSNLVLAGTQRNCAGGPSPWGWITCEETVVPEHGYAFLCRPDAASLAAPHRLDGYGRFRHEAVAVDPVTHVAYLTEDRTDSCLYRFVPHRRERPFEGRLQALAIVGRPRFDTSRDLHEGETLDAHWIDIDDPTPADDVVRSHARKAGAARVERGEGACFHEGVLYVTATEGGPTQSGQILRYVPRGPDGGELALHAQARGRDLFDMPDNLTVAPWGDLYACEDNGFENHVCVFTPDGQVWDFARNALSSGELAGVCFSPDGRALLLNLQDDGRTLLVTGPWDQETPQS